MNVLFVSADLPWPPDGGGKIATLRVLESMARGRDVDLIAMADSVEPPEVGRLLDICRSVSVIDHPFTFGRHRARQAMVAARSLLTTRPYRLEKFRSSRFREAIAEAAGARAYDLIHYDQLGTSLYRDDRFPTTFTAQNVESHIYQLGSQRARRRILRGWARLEGDKLRRAEQRIYARFDQVFALSGSDARMLEDLGAREPIVLPIPIDVEVLSVEPPTRPTILSLGTMSWFGVEDGLLWFHERVLPRIADEVPDVTWTLVGPNAGPRIRDLHDGDRVIVAGYLPSIDDVLRETRVCIVPLHVAGGVRIKLLEMFGRGRPSVATSVGAQGLGFEDGEGCFRRDDPQGFARAVIQLIRDDDLWRTTTQRGADWVGQHHGQAAMDTSVSEGIRRARVRWAQRMGPG